MEASKLLIFAVFQLGRLESVPTGAEGVTEEAYIEEESSMTGNTAS